MPRHQSPTAKALTSGQGATRHNVARAITPTTGRGFGGRRPKRSRAITGNEEEPSGRRLAEKWPPASQKGTTCRSLSGSISLKNCRLETT